MAFHIPFNQREAAREQVQPIYIGFEVPRYQAPAAPRKKFNWWGFNGMWMSFVSLVSAGFLSPVPLLISLIGLRREGKKMAITGTLVSLGGIALASSLVVGGIAAENYEQQAQAHRHYKAQVQKQTEETKSLLDVAAIELIDFRDENGGALPTDIDANMLVLKHVDAWGESLRYDAEVNHGVVRSAGPDKEFDSRDDIVIKVRGETERTPLLKLDGQDSDVNSDF